VAISATPEPLFLYRAAASNSNSQWSSSCVPSAESVTFYRSSVSIELGDYGFIERRKMPISMLHSAAAFILRALYKVEACKETELGPDFQKIFGQT